MKTRAKRLGRLLALLPLLGLTALPVMAEDAPAGGTSEDGKWSFTDYGDGTVSATCLDKEVTEVTIPGEWEGKPVTMVEVDAFKDCAALKKVTLPETVTVIDDYAFYSCPVLEEITIPDALTKIGFQAFYGCAALKEMHIPAAVTEIEDFAFEGCNALTAIEVDAACPGYKDEDGILFSKDGTVLLVYPSAKEGTEYTVPAGCEEVHDYAFMGNTFLEHIDIHGITRLGEDTFYHCTALQEMTIPDAITELNGSVFGTCTALQSVTLPAGLTSIGDGCFYMCVALEDIALPETVQKIGDYAFYSCGTLKTITIPETCTDIGEYALGFYSDGENTARLPDFTVDAKKGTAAFDYCAANSIACTGGVTQESTFFYIVIGVVVVAVIIIVILVIYLKKVQKRYEIR